MNSGIHLQPVRGFQLSSLRCSHRSLRAQPGWERGASIKERILLVSSKMKNNPNKPDKIIISPRDLKRKAAKGKDMLLHRCASFVANESGTARLASCGTAKCRNPLGHESELVRREPAESVRLERRIRYKNDEMSIHSLNDINILLSISSTQ